MRMTGIGVNGFERLSQRAQGPVENNRQSFALEKSNGGGAPLDIFGGTNIIEMLFSMLLGGGLPGIGQGGPPDVVGTNDTNGGLLGGLLGGGGAGSLLGNLPGLDIVGNLFGGGGLDFGQISSLGDQLGNDEPDPFGIGDQIKGQVGQLVNGVGDKVGGILSEVTGSLADDTPTGTGAIGASIKSQILGGLGGLGGGGGESDNGGGFLGGILGGGSGGLLGGLFS